MNQLVLSLFPGIGLLDMAFEEEGFCVVRGPDLLWGGDVKRFHPTPGRFDGIIGGPPCQHWCGLGAVNRKRWGEHSVMPDMIPDFLRCVREAQPAWFLMENSPRAPVPEISGYSVIWHILNNRWFGGTQSRVRRFSFGSVELDASWDCGARDCHPVRRPTTRGSLLTFRDDLVALEHYDMRPTVVSTGQSDWKGSAKRYRAGVPYMLETQGFASDSFRKSPFTVTELRRAIGNGVPLPMGRAVARAVKRALGMKVAA